MEVIRQAGGGFCRGLLALAALLAGCASIPKHQYVVDELHLIGMRELETEPLATCLVTKARPEVTFRLGFGGPSCGDPPFESIAPALHLWSWPWMEWPVFDPAIFAVDKRRIQRWFEARGYYQARVTSTRTYADEALVEGARCPSDDASDCKLEVFVQLEEGEPVRIREVTLDAKPALPAALRAALQSSLRLREGDRFDEALYGSSGSSSMRTAENTPSAKMPRCASSTIDWRNGSPRGTSAASMIRASGISPAPSTRVRPKTVLDAGSSRGRSMTTRPPTRASAYDGAWIASSFAV